MRFRSKAFLVLIGLLFVVFLGGCSSTEEQGVGETVQDAAGEATDAVQDAAEETGEAMEDAAEETGEAMEEAGEEVKEAAEDVQKTVEGGGE